MQASTPKVNSDELPEMVINKSDGNVESPKYNLSSSKVRIQLEEKVEFPLYTLLSSIV